MAAIHAALGVAFAIIERNKSGMGQVVDVALYESIFNLLEGIVPEYDGAGVVREPSGTTITGIVPTNTYACADGKYVVIGGNGDSIFKRLMTEAGREDMANDPELKHNQGRVIHEQRIDDALAQWCSAHKAADIIAKLEVLDEPTTGLHFEDIRQLLDVLHRLRDGGNTVVIIEHNLDVIKTADWVVDLGPEGGSGGGQIIATGTPEEVAKNKKSHTGKFLAPLLK